MVTGKNWHDHSKIENDKATDLETSFANIPNEFIKLKAIMQAPWNVPMYPGEDGNETANAVTNNTMNAAQTLG